MNARSSLFALLLIAVAVGCGGEAKLQPEVDLEHHRNQREALTALENQLNQLAQTAADLQVVSAKVTLLAEQVEQFEASMSQLRELVEADGPSAQAMPRATNWLTDAWIFVLGIAVAMILYFAYRLLRGYDEIELPAEAYTPGMTSEAPPPDNETPLPDEAPSPPERRTIRLDDPEPTDTGESD